MNEQMSIGKNDRVNWIRDQECLIFLYIFFSIYFCNQYILFPPILYSIFSLSPYKEIDPIDPIYLPFNKMNKGRRIFFWFKIGFWIKQFQVKVSNFSQVVTVGSQQQVQQGRTKFIFPPILTMRFATPSYCYNL